MGGFGVAVGEIEPAPWVGLPTFRGWAINGTIWPMSEPSSSPSPEPSPKSGKRRGGNPAKLRPGLKPNQVRGADGRIRSKAGLRELGRAELPMLEAMRRIISRPPEDDDTYQLRTFREWRRDEASNFYQKYYTLQADEDERLRAAGVSGDTPERKWDGVGACPCCGREPERAIEDASTDYVIGVIDRLLAEGRNDVESE